MSSILTVLWAGGVAATPVALVVAALCRCKGLRPATRHALWLAVLASFVTPAVGMLVWRPDWSRSERIIAAADRVIERLGAGGTASVSTAGVSKITVAEPDPGARDAAPARDEAPASAPRSVPGATGPAPAPVLPRIGAAPSSDRPAAHAEPSRRSPSRGPARGGPSIAREHDDRGPARIASGLPLAPQVEFASTSMPTRVVTPSDRPVPDAAPVTTALDLGAPQPMVDPVAVPVPVVDRTSSASVLDSARASIVASPEPVPSGERGGSPEPAPASGVDRSALKTAAPAWSSAREWVAGVVALRDAIMELPPVPVAVWVGGAVLIFGVRAFRTLAAVQVLRRSRPAGEGTTALVRGVAADLGLRRVPEVVIVDSTVSPMIWCGLRPRLVLPSTLWRALDADSRRAVVVHELAHLKRRDHVLCWIESIIGAAYWWHPVAWWARQRLRDEAEACCDAWVTSLLPRSRRAYAAALVATKSYLSGVEKGQGPSGAGPWLGVMSGSARKLARRITMVMTQRTAPKVSMVGACVAVLVVAVGTFVTPTIACPPEERQKKAAAPSAVIVTRGEKAKKRAEKADDAPSVTFFGEAPALEAMRDGNNPFGQAVPAAPRTPQPPAAARAPKPPKAPKAPKPPQAAGALNVYGLSGQATSPAPVDLEALKVGRTLRVYRLPEGKRDAFWGLMSRSDVPVLVEMRGDGVGVYATDEQHPVLESFIKMIQPDGSGVSVITVPGNPLAVTVPGTPMPSLGVAGQGMNKAYREAMREHELARARVRGDADRARADAERVLAEQKKELARLGGQLQRDAHAMAQDHAKMRVDLERAQAEQGQQLRTDALRERSRSLEQREQSLRRLIEALERKADALSELVDDLESRDDSDEDVEVDESDEQSALDALDTGSFESAFAPGEFALAALAPMAFPGDVFEGTAVDEECDAECPEAGAESCDEACEEARDEACDEACEQPCPEGESEQGEPTPSPF